MAKRKSKRIEVIYDKLGRSHAWGLAIGDDEEPMIVIDPRQPEKELINTIVHETYHILHPELTEAQVIKFSNVMSDVLWREGYRRIHQ